MIILNPGIYGSTRETWRTMPLRYLLQQVLDEHPTWSRDDQTKIYIERAVENPQLVEEALRRCFDNDYSALSRPKPGPKPEAKPGPKPDEPSAEFIAIRDHFYKTMLSMDFILPNGKPLRDATGSYVASLGAAHQLIGNVFVVIGKRVGANQRVGDVLTDDDLKRVVEIS